MEIDHIFIFSNNEGIESESLVESGFTEGSNRRHKGQGTINRKFYFENFFLEILWVVDQNEITQTPTKETGLWERANYTQNTISRFGLCLLNEEGTDNLFEQCQIYQPNYFPQGMSIDILPNQNQKILPWTFRLPYRGEKKAVTEPTQHKNEIKQLTKASFGINEKHTTSPFISFFKNSTSINFHENKQLELLLEFDNGIQQKNIEIKELDLKIVY